MNGISIYFICSLISSYSIGNCDVQQFLHTFKQNICDKQMLHGDVECNTNQDYHEEFILEKQVMDVEETSIKVNMSFEKKKSWIYLGVDQDSFSILFDFGSIFDYLAEIELVDNIGENEMPFSISSDLEDEDLEQFDHEGQQEVHNWNKMHIGDDMTLPDDSNSNDPKTPVVTDWLEDFLINLFFSSNATIGGVNADMTNKNASFDSVFVWNPSQWWTLETDHSEQHVSLFSLVCKYINNLDNILRENEAHRIRLEKGWELWIEYVTSPFTAVVGAGKSFMYIAVTPVSIIADYSISVAEHLTEAWWNYTGVLYAPGLTGKNDLPMGTGGSLVPFYPMKMKENVPDVREEPSWIQSLLSPIYYASTPVTWSLDYMKLLISPLTNQTGEWSNFLLSPIYTAINSSTIAENPPDSLDGNVINEETILEDTVAAKDIEQVHVEEPINVHIFQPICIDCIAPEMENSWVYMVMTNFKYFCLGTYHAISHLNEMLKNALHEHYEWECLSWYAKEKANPPDYSEVPLPPCTFQEAVHDTRFKSDTSCNMGRGYCPFFHPGAYHCIRSTSATKNGYGAQACYNQLGELLNYEAGGGTFDKVHPDGHVDIDYTTFPPQIKLFKLWRISHFIEDVWPFVMCCKFTKHCDWHGEVRPTSKDCVHININRFENWPR